ncbi:MAG: DUF4282 domain-containing protein [Caulobacteraceae bacterium]
MARRTGRSQFSLRDWLSLEHLMTGSIIHLVYWAGLGIVLLGGFGVVGGAVGVALKEGEIMGWLLALPTMVAGLLVVAAMALIWRSFCEFYVVVFKIGEDLRVMRQAVEADNARDLRPTPVSAEPQRQTLT